MECSLNCWEGCPRTRVTRLGRAPRGVRIGAMGGLLADIAQWIADAVYPFAFVGVFALSFLGNRPLPVPTQLTLPLSGYLIWEGRFSFTAVMVASTAAAVSVSFVFYYVGASVSEESLRRSAGRYGRFVLVRESDLDKVSKTFERHGGTAILIFLFFS